MPDYSACKGVKCEKKNKCCRYLMVWGHWQSVMQPDPKTCVHFWDVKSGAPFKLKELQDVKDQSRSDKSKGEK